MLRGVRSRGGRRLLTGAVYQFPVLRIVLLVGNDERQQRDGLARARGHFQDRVTTSIERFYPGVSRGFWVPRAGSQEVVPTFKITHVAGDKCERSAVR